MAKHQKQHQNLFGEIDPPWMTRPFLDEFIRHYSASYDAKKALSIAGRKFGVTVHQLNEHAVYQIQNNSYVCSQLKKRARIVKEHNFNYTKERMEVELVRRTYEFDPTELYEFVDREINHYDSKGNLVETTTVRQMELKDPSDWSDVAKKMIKGIKNTPNGIQLILKDDTAYIKMLGDVYGAFVREEDDEDNGEPVTLKISVADGRVDVDHLARG